MAQTQPACPTTGGTVEVPRLLVVADVDGAGGPVAWEGVLLRLAGLPPGLQVAVQVRAKGRPPAELRQLGAKARELLADRVPVVLNGPPAVACTLRLAGVHWPEAEIPSAVPREAEGLLRSASVHGLVAVRRARRVAHYVLFGPVFEPRSKPGTGAGVEALRQACAASRLPVLAIGGVTAERVPLCVQAGAAGVAVVSAVVRAADPAREVLRLLDALPGG